MFFFVFFILCAFPWPSHLCFQRFRGMAGKKIRARSDTVENWNTRLNANCRSEKRLRPLRFSARHLTLKTLATFLLSTCLSFKVLKSTNNNFRIRQWVVQFPTNSCESSICRRSDWKKTTISRYSYTRRQTINQAISLRVFLYNSIRSVDSVKNILLDSSIVKMIK